MKQFTIFLCALLVAMSVSARTPEEAEAMGLQRVGTEVSLDETLNSPDYRPARGMWKSDEGLVNNQDPAELIWSKLIHYPDATYIAPHFSRMDLPKGAYLIVRSPDGTREWEYRGEGKEGLGRSGEGFWGIHIAGETAVIELYSVRPVRAGAVVIDRYARGFVDWEAMSAEPESICGTDESQWAKCYQTSQATAYNKSKAVARLLIGGSSACTGWLVGSEGHVLTNEHCIGTASAAQNVNFEFMAEGSTCSTSCASWGACAGTVVATTSTLIKVNATLDYALVKLPTNPTATYGYLQMRNSGAVLNERIYIPQHPAHWGKQIAMVAGGANAKIDSLSAPACSGGTSDLGYAADTQGGSSGSPVLGYSDNLVVGLHHCGTCPNRAVPINAVITSLGTSAPANSVVGGGGGGTGPTTLTNGVAVTGLGASTGAWKHYVITVPSGQASLKIEMSGGSGDADLYVKLGSQPTSSSYDYRPYLGGNAETVNVTNPSAGSWYVSVYAYSTYASVSLKATYAASTTPTCTSYTGTLSSSGSSSYKPSTSGYVSSVSGSHTGKLTGPSSADFDLYLQKLSGTSWSTVARSEGSTSTENITYSGTSGTYRWRVYAYSGTGSFTLCTTKP